MSKVRLMFYWIFGNSSGVTFIWIFAPKIGKNHDFVPLEFPKMFSILNESTCPKSEWFLFDFRNSSLNFRAKDNFNETYVVIFKHCDALYSPGIWRKINYHIHLKKQKLFSELWFARKLGHPAWAVRGFALGGERDKQEMIISSVPKRILFSERGSRQSKNSLQ